MLFLAAVAAEPHPLSMLPFAAMLLCIALLPLILRHHWERFYHLIALGLAAITASYYIFGLENSGRLLHELRDYVSFIVLLGSLFIVAGGIHFTLRGEATPWQNCAFLFGGGLLSNVIGTTGASMLLIRPWIRLNRRRYAGLHTAFFIFVISNTGGGLTPIGDPPLLLGFLKGVPFWWVIQNCWKPWLIAICGIIAIFYLVDRWHDRKSFDPNPADDGIDADMKFQGARNLWFLGLILLAVFVNDPPFLREALMVLAAAASYYFTPKMVHRANNFSFLPIKEVAWLFLGIFTTMVPVLDYMKGHADTLGLRSPGEFFWVTGVLSSVLDNAPTYLTMLANALGLQELSIESADDVRAFLPLGGPVLAAISMGAVLFGAITYIGNGPNFMVKAIVQQQGKPAPGFFGYIFFYALPVFLPVLALVWFFSFR